MQSMLPLLRKVIALPILTFTLRAFADAPFNPDLVTFLRLDGDALDSSQHGRNGEATALAFRANRFGFVDSAGQFDGVATRILVPHPSAFNLLPTTVSAWVTLDENESTDIGLVSNYYTASANGWGIFVSGNFVRSWYYGSSGSVPTGVLQTSPLPKNQWRHLVATFDSSGGRLYLDGKPVADGAWSGSANASTSSLGLLLGEMLSQSGARKNFKGGIDDVRIFSRALSGTEVQSLHDYEANPFRRARGSAVLTNGSLASISIEDGGQGFTEPPRVDILGTGSGA